MTSEDFSWLMSVTRQSFSHLLWVGSYSGIIIHKNSETCKIQLLWEECIIPTLRTHAHGTKSSVHGDHTCKHTHVCINGESKFKSLTSTIGLWPASINKNKIQIHLKTLYFTWLFPFNNSTFFPSIHFFVFLIISILKLLFLARVWAHKIWLMCKIQSIGISV